MAAASKKSASPKERVPGRKTMTLNLTHDEWDMLEALAEELGMTKMGVLRSSLHLFRRYSAETKKGRKLIIEDEDGNQRTELYVVLAD